MFKHVSGFGSAAAIYGLLGRARNVAFFRISADVIPRTNETYAYNTRYTARAATSLWL